MRTVQLIVLPQPWIIQIVFFAFILNMQNEDLSQVPISYIVPYAEVGASFQQ